MYSRILLCLKCMKGFSLTGRWGPRISEGRTKKPKEESKIIKEKVTLAQEYGRGSCWCCSIALLWKLSSDFEVYVDIYVLVSMIF